MATCALQFLFALMRGVSASASLCSIWFCLTTSACLEASLTGISQFCFFFAKSQLVLFIVFFHFFIRMCEYVDHLHEHFASPVLIRNAHYMAPKVRSIPAKVYFAFVSTFVALHTVFRILDILVRCWNHRCSLTATRRETYGRQSQANEK